MCCSLESIVAKYDFFFEEANRIPNLSLQRKREYETVSDFVMGLANN